MVWSVSLFQPSKSTRISMKFEITEIQSNAWLNLHNLCSSKRCSNTKHMWFLFDMNKVRCSGLFLVDEAMFQKVATLFQPNKWKFISRFVPAEVRENRGKLQNHVKYFEFHWKSHTSRSIFAWWKWHFSIKIILKIRKMLLHT